MTQLSPKAIIDINEIKRYVSENNLDSIILCRQKITNNIETTNASLFAGYLKRMGIIREFKGCEYEEDWWNGKNRDKTLLLWGEGIYIYPKNGEIKSLLFRYELANPSKFYIDKRERPIRIYEILCERLSIYSPKPILTPNNPLNYIKCEGRPIVEFWEDLVNRLNYFLGFDVIVDISPKVRGKNAKEYYPRDYPEFVEKDNRAVLIENFNIGDARKLEELYPRRYIPIVIGERIRFGKNIVSPFAILIPSDELRERVIDAKERAIDDVLREGERNVIKILDNLWRRFDYYIFSHGY